jgi:dCTP deaminase
MILSDTRILEEIEKGTIKIEPYDRSCLGSNSYDVHLGKWLATYKEHIIDAKKHNLIDQFEIPEEGFVLYPHIFYLGVTEEYTETHARSLPRRKIFYWSPGHRYSRYGWQGRCWILRNWTLEISVKQPVKIYKGMPIGSLSISPLMVKLK